MVVTNLFEYPVKGLLGHEINCAIVNRRGLGMDRRWMLVDAGGNFISQRELSTLTQFRPEYQDDLIIKHLPTADVRAIDKSVFSELLTVTVWGQECAAHGASNGINQWFSDKLKIPVRLVFMGENDIRPVASANNSDIVSFADDSPVLLTTLASLSELNNRLADGVEINRFRPNILIDGVEPYAEDQWRNVKIGQVEFRVVKLCARCHNINIDQHTGLAGKEPLKTLSTYRKVGNRVNFGVYLTPANEGIIHEGDEVIVLN